MWFLAFELGLRRMGHPALYGHGHPALPALAATPRPSCQLGSSRDAPSYLPRYGAAIARDALRWTRLDPLPEWVRGTSSAATMADSFAQFKEVRAPRPGPRTLESGGAGGGITLDCGAYAGAGEAQHGAEAGGDP